MADIASVPTVRVGGLHIAAIDRRETADFMVDLAHKRAGTEARPWIMTSANGQVLSLAARDNRFKRLCENADLISADGQPMVIVSRLFSSAALPERVATTDLFHDVAARADQAHLSFYFLGATQDENDRAVAHVQARYPGIRIAGARHGFFPAVEESEVASRIAEVRPDILWVSLGVPREQEFIVRQRDRLHGVGVVKTSGGLFNFLSGKNPRAPRWMQRAGLEWLHRMCFDPRRLGWRYASTNLHALYLLFRLTGPLARQSPKSTFR